MDGLVLSVLCAIMEISPSWPQSRWCLVASDPGNAVLIHASRIVSGSADCRPPKNAVGGLQIFQGLGAL
jgi:hypothetical protein